MNIFNRYELLESRRRFLQNTGMGLGTAAMASLVAPQANATPNRATGLHFPPKDSYLLAGNLNRRIGPGLRLKFYSGGLELD